MGYVIAVVIVLLLVAGFVTFFVFNATRRGGPAAPSDPGAEGNPAGIAAPDESALGDTSQHSGEGEGRAPAPVEEGQGEEKPATSSSTMIAAMTYPIGPALPEGRRTKRGRRAFGTRQVPVCRSWPPGVAPRETPRDERSRDGK